MNTTKPFNISKQLAWEAYKRVKVNKGAAGVDGESIAEFERNLKGTLYKLWNRISSGSYFPPPVRLVEIPKSDGKKRQLGITTVSDRITQMVAKIYLEPLLESHFHEDSYGYRSNKSALDAVGKTRQKCWTSEKLLEYVNADDKCCKSANEFISTLKECREAGEEMFSAADAKFFN